MLNFNRRGLYKNQNRKIKFFLLPINLNVQVFCFYMHLYLDGPNLFDTEQIWDFSHTINSAQCIQMWFSRGEGEETGCHLQFSKSLVCTAAFSWLLGFEIVMS